MEVYSRRQGRERGLATYFTGNPCPSGHVAERRVHNSECVECGRLKGLERHYRLQSADESYRAKNSARALAFYEQKQVPVRAAKAERIAGWIAAARVSRPDLEIVTRDAALAAGLSAYFIGRPCPKGHVAERSVKNHSCLECRRALKNKWAAENSEQVRENYARWHTENPGAVRAKNHTRRARLLSAAYGRGYRGHPEGPERPLRLLQAAAQGPG